ncbi:MAG TPA: hypothetical protein VIV61_06015 [Candidatus Ozemobacteraceae bacterium]
MVFRQRLLLPGRSRLLFSVLFLLLILLALLALLALLVLLILLSLLILLILLSLLILLALLSLLILLALLTLLILLALLTLLILLALMTLLVLLSLLALLVLFGLLPTPLGCLRFHEAFLRLFEIVTGVRFLPAGNGGLVGVDSIGKPTGAVGRIPQVVQGVGNKPRRCGRA